VRLSGVATEDVYNLQVEKRDPAKEYGKLARSWRANVVRISLHPSTWRYYESETLTLHEEHVQNATYAGLFVIVDYHVIGFPHSYYEGVPSEWGGPPKLYARTSPWFKSSEMRSRPGSRTGTTYSSSGTSRSNEEDELSPSDPDGSR
jgi:hypothetical protein